MPLSAWLWLTDRPGEVAGSGTADADTCRDLAERLAAHPATRWCLTLTDLDGRAVAHACAPHCPPDHPTTSPHLIRHPTWFARRHRDRPATSGPPGPRTAQIHRPARFHRPPGSGSAPVGRPASAPTARTRRQPARSPTG